MPVIKSTRSQACALIGLEAVLIVLVALIIWVFAGLSYSYSFFLGGLVSIIPNLFFVFRVFRENKASAAKRIVKAFYRNEAIKLLLMAFIFIVFVKLFNLELLPFVLGFLVAQMGVWLSPILFLKP